MRRPERGPHSPVQAMVQAGVVARVTECAPDWCRLVAGGYRGWAHKDALWGVEADEVFD